MLIKSEEYPRCDECSTPVNIYDVDGKKNCCGLFAMDWRKGCPPWYPFLANGSGYMACPGGCTDTWYETPLTFLSHWQLTHNMTCQELTRQLGLMNQAVSQWVDDKNEASDLGACLIGEQKRG